MSIATVSRVQRGLHGVTPATRELVLDAIENLRYRPSSLARGLASRHHGATGIVFPDLSGPYYADVILGYEGEVVARGESLLILGTHEREESSELVLDLVGRVDGLLVMARTVPDDVVRALGRDGVPVVLLGRPSVGRIPAVRERSFESAVHLTEHLLHGHGLRRLVFIGDPSLSPDVAERWRGFADAHRRAGLEAPAPVLCRFREADGHDAALRALSEPARPSGLVCGNDEMAIGACGAAERLGLRVPADVAVTGWDDIPLARFLPSPLTTVRQPTRELGATAARLLFDLIGGSSLAESESLPTELVVRASCGCPRNDDSRHQEVAPT